MAMSTYDDDLEHTTSHPSSRPALAALLTAKDVAHLLNVHVGQVRTWTTERKIPCVRLGRAVRYRPDVIEGLLAVGIPGTTDPGPE